MERQTVPAVPRAPELPGWLDSLCSQIDAFSDVSLPHVFTPREQNEPDPKQLSEERSSEWCRRHRPSWDSMPSDARPDLFDSTSLTTTSNSASAYSAASLPLQPWPSGNKVQGRPEQVQFNTGANIQDRVFEPLKNSGNIRKKSVVPETSAFQWKVPKSKTDKTSLKPAHLRKHVTRVIPKQGAVKQVDDFNPFCPKEPSAQKSGGCCGAKWVDDVPLSQPWPSLTPANNNRYRSYEFGPQNDSHMDVHDQDSVGMSQPWPSCDTVSQNIDRERMVSAGGCQQPLDIFSSSQTNVSSAQLPSYLLLTSSPVLSLQGSLAPASPAPELSPFHFSRESGIRPASSKQHKAKGVLEPTQAPDQPHPFAADPLHPSVNKTQHSRTKHLFCTPSQNSDVPVQTEEHLSSVSVRRGEDSSGFHQIFATGKSLAAEGGTPRTGRDFNPLTPAVIDLPAVPYQEMFSFPFFNAVQSLAFDQLLYSDQSVVVSAPTGSGKTVLFELALVRLLLCAQVSPANIRVIYMAPMKSLCSERVEDWVQKLTPLGLKCLELTGDSDLADFTSVQHAHVICTTPEKWDSVTRRWKDNRRFFQDISLMCIDEVHIVGDSERGATVEAVITRMKMVQSQSPSENVQPVRFVAVSATLPNTEDFAEWLSSSCNRAAVCKLGEEYRPVKLHRVVLGFPFSEGTSEFRFDIGLTYKLRPIIDTYSQGKPTLVFCSSRKSVQQTGEALVKQKWGQPTSFLQNKHRQDVHTAASAMQDKKISSLVMCGVGVHHAGMGLHDRKIVEDLFKSGMLPVLIATSTLSVGVNLPAHLVIIKATHMYVMGVAKEYPDLQVLQMTGRAGRPQFDTSATVVIMTKAQLKSKYEALVNGTQIIESTLHKNLTEHINVEVVLHTITDIADAVTWLTHTFLHVRVTKNPHHYGLSAGVDAAQVEKKLQELCVIAMNKLSSLDLLSIDPETTQTSPTERGRLMARYCLEFQTMKILVDIPAESSLEDLVKVMTGCPEFADIQLRTNEKKTLNSLNKHRSQETIRYPMQGKIKTKQMKVNCLIQAGLGCLPVQDFSLSQDLTKVFRVGQRITRCLMELQWLGSDFASLLHACQLCKSFKARLWPDSKHVARQLEGIGPTISQALMKAGLTSFQALEASNPRQIELVANRHPPFGSRVHEAVAHLPRYQLLVQQVNKHQHDTSHIVVTLSILNAEDIKTDSTCGRNHQSVIIIGDEDNKVVFKWRLTDNMLMSAPWRRSIHVKRAQKGGSLTVAFVSLDWVGLDIHTVYHPIYTGRLLFVNRTEQPVARQTQTSETRQETNRGRQASNPQEKKGTAKKQQQAKPKGSRSANGIQQQLDVMMSKLQQFEYTRPKNVEILHHNRPSGMDGQQIQSAEVGVSNSGQHDNISNMHDRQQEQQQSTRQQEEEQAFDLNYDWEEWDDDLQFDDDDGSLGAPTPRKLPRIQPPKSSRNLAARPGVLRVNGIPLVKRTCNTSDKNISDATAPTSTSGGAPKPKFTFKRTGSMLGNTGKDAGSCGSVGPVTSAQPRSAASSVPVGTSGSFASGTMVPFTGVSGVAGLSGGTNSTSLELSERNVACCTPGNTAPSGHTTTTANPSSTTVPSTQLSGVHSGAMWENPVTAPGQNTTFQRPAHPSMTAVQPATPHADLQSVQARPRMPVLFRPVLSGGKGNAHNTSDCDVGTTTDKALLSKDAGKTAVTAAVVKPLFKPATVSTLSGPRSQTANYSLSIPKMPIYTPKNMCSSGIQSCTGSLANTDMSLYQENREDSDRLAVETVVSKSLPSDALSRSSAEHFTRPAKPAENRPDPIKTRHTNRQRAGWDELDLYHQNRELLFAQGTPPQEDSEGMRCNDMVYLDDQPASPIYFQTHRQMCANSVPCSTDNSPVYLAATATSVSSWRDQMVPGKAMPDAVGLLDGIF